MADDDAKAEFGWTEHLFVRLNDGCIIGRDIVFVKEAATGKLIRSCAFGLEDVGVELEECGIFFGYGCVIDS